MESRSQIDPTSRSDYNVLALQARVAKNFEKFKVIADVDGLLLQVLQFYSQVLNENPEKEVRNKFITEFYNSNYYAYLFDGVNVATILQNVINDLGQITKESEQLSFSFQEDFYSRITKAINWANTLLSVIKIASDRFIEKIYEEYDERIRGLIANKEVASKILKMYVPIEEAGLYSSPRLSAKVQQNERYLELKLNLDFKLLEAKIKNAIVTHDNLILPYLRFIEKSFSDEEMRNFLIISIWQKYVDLTDRMSAVKDSEQYLLLKKDWENFKNTFDVTLEVTDLILEQFKYFGDLYQNALNDFYQLAETIHEYVSGYEDTSNSIHRLLDGMPIGDRIATEAAIGEFVETIDRIIKKKIRLSEEEYTLFMEQYNSLSGIFDEIKGFKGFIKIYQLIHQNFKAASSYLSDMLKISPYLNATSCDRSTIEANDFEHLIIYIFLNIKLVKANFLETESSVRVKYDGGYSVKYLPEKDAASLPYSADFLMNSPSEVLPSSSAAVVPLPASPPTVAKKRLSMSFFKTTFPAMLAFLPRQSDGNLKINMDSVSPRGFTNLIASLRDEVKFQAQFLPRTTNYLPIFISRQLSSSDVSPRSPREGSSRSSSRSSSSKGSPRGPQVSPRSALSGGSRSSPAPTESGSPSRSPQRIAEPVNSVSEASSSCSVLPLAASRKTGNSQSSPSLWGSGTTLVQAANSSANSSMPDMRLSLSQSSTSSSSDQKKVKFEEKGRSTPSPRR